MKNHLGRRLSLHTLAPPWLNQVNAVPLIYDGTRSITRSSLTPFALQALSKASNHSMGFWLPPLKVGKSTSLVSLWTSFTLCAGESFLLTHLLIGLILLYYLRVLVRLSLLVFVLRLNRVTIFSCRFVGSIRDA